MRHQAGGECNDRHGCNHALPTRDCCDAEYIRRGRETRDPDESERTNDPGRQSGDDRGDKRQQPEISASRSPVVAEPEREHGQGEECKRREQRAMLNRAS